MKFACPYCRRECDYEDIQMDADLHAIIKILPTFGPHHNLVTAYTELFGISPLKTRRKKWRLLLEEMKRLFDSESFAYQKRTYPISQAGIAEALNIIVHKHWDSHLENHNYLKKIMISIAEASAKIDGKEAEKDLRKKEAGLMAGDRGSNPPASPLAKGGKKQEEPPFEKGGQGGFYELPTEHVLPPMKSMPVAHLTEAQIVENKRKVRELMKKIGG